MTWNSLDVSPHDIDLYIDRRGRCRYAELDDIDLKLQQNMLLLQISKRRARKCELFWPRWIQNMLQRYFIHFAGHMLLLVHPATIYALKGGTMTGVTSVQRTRGVTVKEIIGAMRCITCCNRLVIILLCQREDMRAILIILYGIT